MGNALSNCLCKRHRIGCSREITLLMVGLDNAGKTCAVKHLLGQQNGDSVPTVGFSSVSLKQGRNNVTIYDLGGGPKIRGIWEKYFALVHGLIFVVDSCDQNRLAECKAEIRRVLENEKIAGKPMLVLMNKSESKCALSEHQLVEELDLEFLVNKQKCPTRVESSCALFDKKRTKDPGIVDGFNWLLSIIDHHFERLHQRVEEDVSRQKELEAKEQAERIARVQKLREERERLAAAEGEGHENSAAKLEEDDDDDMDVIIGNPFKSCDLIRAELEQKDLKAKELSTPAVRVIHVSPTNSAEASNREEVILLAQPLANATHSTQPSSLSNFSGSGECNGTSLPPFCVEEDTKKMKKNKKRFKNRIVPDLGDANVSLISKPSELPPLRPGMDLAGSREPVFYMSPKRSHNKNGQVNWAAVEELEPCREVSNTGCRRIEAWKDPLHP